MSYIDDEIKKVEEDDRRLNEILSKDRGLVREEIINGIKIKLVSHESQGMHTVIEYEDGENAEFFPTYGAAVLHYEMLKKKYETDRPTI